MKDGSQIEIPHKQMHIDVELHLYRHLTLSDGLMYPRSSPISDECLRMLSLYSATSYNT